MEYIALRCIIGDEVYTKGEIIKNLPEEKAKRLLEKGAIREADAPFSHPAETDAGKMNPAEDETAGQDDADNADDEEDEGEEAEAPEIDAMDGVVAAPAEEKKPARRKGKGGDGK